MKCHQCDRPAMYLVGDKDGAPLCLDCYAKRSHISKRCPDHTLAA